MKKALVVGISNYNGRYGNLPGCMNDVQEWSDLLSSCYGFDSENVRLLADARATKSAIVERLNWLFADSAATHLVFCFAGHGARLRRRNYESGDLDDNMDETLVSFPTSQTEDIQAHLLFDDDLADIVRNSNVNSSTKVTMIFDSCHSGGMLRMTVASDSPPLPRAIEIPIDIAHRAASIESIPVNRIGTLAGVADSQVICAAALDVESAWDAGMDDGMRHGVFTYHATRALRSKPNLSFHQLVESIRPKVAQRFPQHPTLLGNHGRFSTPFLD